MAIIRTRRAVSSVRRKRDVRMSIQSTPVSHPRSGWLSLAVVLLLALLGCSTKSASSSTSSEATRSPGPTAATATVTSTIDGMSVLPHRVHWEAKPSVRPEAVSEVDFLIDSHVAWTENNAPYSYGADGNWLVTSFLTPGRHQFETLLVTVDGQKVTDKVAAMVGKATPPPASVSGKWMRNVTSSDISKATSGQPPPAGRWSLTINEVGWKLGDPQGSGGLNDVAYLAPGRLAMRPTIEVPPFPNDGNGGFCHEPDPQWRWAYTLSNHDKTMRLTPIGQDPCGDRAAIYQGNWTRTSN
jgi:hypothetical protein